MNAPETSSRTPAGTRQWSVGFDYETIQHQQTGEEFRVPVPIDYEELCAEQIKIAGIIERYGGHFQIAPQRVEVAEGVWICHGVLFQMIPFVPGKRMPKAETNGKPVEQPEEGGLGIHEPDSEPEPVPVEE